MKKASPPIHAEASHSQGNISSTRSKAQSKISRVLAHLLHHGPLNRFEAERIGDHCLNSTISVLANNHGLAFERTPEKVPNNWGRPCDVIRYGLPESQHAQADQTLALMFSRIPKAPEVTQ